MTGVGCSVLVLLPNANLENTWRKMVVSVNNNLRFHRRQLIMYVIKVGPIKKDLPSLNLCACVRLVCVMV